MQKPKRNSIIAALKGGERKQVHTSGAGLKGRLKAPMPTGEAHTVEMRRRKVAKIKERMMVVLEDQPA